MGFFRTNAPPQATSTKNKTKMSTSHRYNTRSKKQKDTDPIPIPTSCALHNTRSTNFDEKTRKTGKDLCNKALNTPSNSNDRVEKMIEFMRWIRTHKRLLEGANFKRTCYKKCNEYGIGTTSTIVSKHVKSKLLKSLFYESSLILDIIKNEF
jgi:hypothetical protein